MTRISTPKPTRNVGKATQNRDTVGKSTHKGRYLAGPGRPRMPPRPPPTAEAAAYSGRLPRFDSISHCQGATGIPTAAMRLAKRRGCNAFSHGRVDLELFLRWWFSQDESDSTTDWTRELRKAQALRQRIALSEDQSRVIDRDVVRQEWARAAALVFASLDRVFCSELPAALAGLPALEIANRCRAAVEEIRTVLPVEIKGQQCTAS